MATPTSNTEWPSPALAEPVKVLINRAFETADLKAEDCGERVAREVFVPTGKMVINKKTFAGSQAIADLQNASWKVLQARTHRIHKVFRAGPADDTFMFFGTASWTFNNGAYVEAPFANRWIIEGADTDDPKIVLFQAFADMSGFDAEAKRQQT
ncbi:hypothetical protein LTR84_007197 [Exophiala bonariae]|uniref:SnoaL-like domain-containing protein n=1 Tax=Exophiala bonariae TaxID=1690606 RepID=A0AAV9MYP5_9EURO|nr:hypothetical protein LTR84_007197 [Exophiala bonariae]